MDKWFLQFISPKKSNFAFYFIHKLVDFSIKELVINFLKKRRTKTVFLPRLSG